MTNTTLQHLADKLGAEIEPQYYNIVIKSVASLDEAESKDITFFENSKLLPKLQSTKAAAVIISPKDAKLYSGCKLIVANPRYAFAILSHMFIYESTISGIHASAVIATSATIHPSATITANCVIGESVTIGENVTIGANCTIADYVTIDSGTTLLPNVAVMHRCKIGARCIIASGAVIGSDGFGYAFDKNAWHKIAHLGIVEIFDDVEIGANTTIDRGTIGKTVLHQGVKLDNQIQVGHNVVIKDHTIIAGCTGIAGSTVIGKYCRIGGGVNINGHINIADMVIIAGSTTVTNSIAKPGTYSSTLSAQPSFEWNRNQSVYRNLHKIIKTIKTSGD